MRTAIVGAGLMGGFHADAVSRSGGHVAWVVDHDHSQAATLSRRHPGARSATAVSPDLLADIDLVHLCTPLDTHEMLAGGALAAGCHVLVEKPLAATTAATDTLLRLAERNAVLLCPTHQYLYQRGTLQAHRSLAGMGALLHVDATACSAGADGKGPAERERLPGEILPHPLALLCRFLGTELAECRWTAQSQGPGELRATSTLGVTTIDVLISARGRPTVNTLRLVAEGGTVHLDLFHGYAINEAGVVSRSRKVMRPLTLSSRTFSTTATNLLLRAAAREPAYPGLRNLVARFHSAARDGGPPPISSVETLAVARARESILDASCPR